MVRNKERRWKEPDLERFKKPGANEKSLLPGMAILDLPGRIDGAKPRIEAGLVQRAVVEVYYEGDENGGSYVTSGALVDSSAAAEPLDEALVSLLCFTGAKLRYGFGPAAMEVLDAERDMSRLSRNPVSAEAAEFLGDFFGDAGGWPPDATVISSRMFVSSSSSVLSVNDDGDLVVAEAEEGAEIDFKPGEVYTLEGRTMTFVTRETRTEEGFSDIFPDEGVSLSGDTDAIRRAMKYIVNRIPGAPLFVFEDEAGERIELALSEIRRVRTLKTI